MQIVMKGNYITYTSYIGKYIIYYNYFDNGGKVTNIYCSKTECKYKFLFELPKFSSEEEIKNYLLLQ